jgi:hypothetical protein
MQYDVKASHLSGSGLMVSGRIRLKNLIYLGTGTAGGIDLFDTTTAPITTGTYARSGYTVTVTQTAHGLTNGQTIGISFAAASNVSATSGTYVVTVLTSSTFTITDLNTGTIAGGTTCVYSTGRWLGGFNTSTGVQPFQVILPGEGVLAENGIYAVITNILFQTVHYG